MFSKSSTNSTTTNANELRFKELLIQIYTIQAKCKTLKELYIGVYDPGYENAAGYNAGIISQSEALIAQQKRLLPEVRALKKNFTDEEHNRIVTEAQAEVNKQWGTSLSI